MHKLHLSRFLTHAAALALVACSSDPGATVPAPDAPTTQPTPDAPTTQPTPDAPTTQPTPDAPTTPAAVLKHPSRSSTVAITDDDQLVVMVNPQDDSISIFKTGDLTARLAKVPTGKEPSSVVLAPDNTTAYVANRADATVVKVTNINTASPTVAGTIHTGSEPTGLALSPTGARLFVAEFAEGSVLDVDTAAGMTQRGVLKGNIQHPYAIAVTNNGDASDDDELLIVPEFFGEPNDQANDATTLDKSRTGRVRIYDLPTLTAQQAISFAPHDTGVTPVGTAATVFASPNQLGAVFIRRDADHPEDNTKARLYIPTVSVSPQGPPRFDGNLFPMVYVGDLGARAEVTTPDGTNNLSDKVRNAGGGNFLAELVDLAFVPSGTSDGSVAYAVARGADAVERISFASTGVTIGGSVNLTIDVIGDPANIHDGCKGPTGIAISADGSRAFVNCWVSQRLGVVSLGNSQKLDSTVEAFPPVAENAALDRGRRFFFTGRGRWSGNGNDNDTTSPTKVDAAWNSCAGCHPAGLSDNVTWIFAAGPRQSTSLDGTFSKGATQKQRILNWTGIFDEIHDFEHNTRGVAGGLGAMTNGVCGVLATETRQALPGNLIDSAKDLESTPGNCRHDWDDIESWIKTVRPPEGLQRLDAAKVAEGAALFGAGEGTDKGNCVTCHGGPGWTISRRFWTPSHDNNSNLALAAFTPNAPWPILWNAHVKQIENEQPGNVGPGEVACVIRNLATASAPNTFGPAALELKPGTGGVAEGAGGFNVPALYGLSLGAPYLHNGQALTLPDLFNNFDGHLKAANDNFAPTAEQKDALIQYLLSIDASTPETTVPAGFDKCVDFP